jgi:acrylyl-CoA reductase (NADPH)
MEYKAWIIREQNDGSFTRSVETCLSENLPDHDLLIRVRFAALNYKDALSASGHKGITRSYPHQPGIDAVGDVLEDRSGKYQVGDKVICTSFDLGMNTPGGFGELIRVPTHWAVPLPESLTMEESMIIGSAGFTAGLALHKMELCGQAPVMGPICVTGASGGVGSLSLALLSHCGYTVIAASGKSSSTDYMLELGASEVIKRSEVDDQSGKPLLKARWAGAIDNVGGNTLATLIKGCDRNGSIACVGLVDSPKLETTVYPFILNGVNLLGIESAHTPLHLRAAIWKRLATDWKLPNLHRIKSVIPPEALDSYIVRMMHGDTRGRIILKYDKYRVLE